MGQPTRSGLGIWSVGQRNVLKDAFYTIKLVLMYTKSAQIITMQLDELWWTSSPVTLVSWSLIFSQYPPNPISWVSFQSLSWLLMFNIIYTESLFVLFLLTKVLIFVSYLKRLWAQLMIKLKTRCPTNHLCSLAYGTVLSVDNHLTLPCE